MLKMFNEYKEAGKISEALLIGRNLFNRNPGNSEIFSAYYDLLCSLSETLPSLADRQTFADQANISLSFYSENVSITDDIVAAISVYQNRITDIFNDIKRGYGEIESSQAQETEKNNTDCLKKIHSVKDVLQNASTQKEFENAIVKLGKMDAEIDRECMTEEQTQLYDCLTKDLTEIINKKASELEYKKNVAYNKRAVDSYADAFKKFRADENKYKNQTQLFSIVSKTLFAYDASRLFNETLIYYNHVYSYIFSKLDDDGKLALTRYSIECERKMR